MKGITNYQEICRRWGEEVSAHRTKCATCQDAVLIGELCPEGLRIRETYTMGIHELDKAKGLHAPFLKDT